MGLWRGWKRRVASDGGKGVGRSGDEGKGTMKGNKERRKEGEGKGGRREERKRWKKEGEGAEGLKGRKSVSCENPVSPVELRLAVGLLRWAMPDDRRTKQQADGRAIVIAT
jgi:hypothetical protein